jgi:hypothetical protein
MAPPGILARAPAPLLATVLALTLAGADAVTAAGKPAVAGATTLPGVYLEEQVAEQGYSRDRPGATAKVWMAEGRMLREQPGGRSILVRADRGKVYVVDPKTLTYFEEDLEVVAASAAAAPAILGEAGDLAAAARLTGNRRRIGRFDSYEVRIADRPVAGSLISIWLSTEVPIDRALVESVDRHAADSPWPALLGAVGQHPGYPVEVSIRTPVGGQILELRRTLTLAEARPIERERFEVPAGLKQVKSPYQARP